MYNNFTVFICGIFSCIPPEISFHHEVGDHGLYGPVSARARNTSVNLGNVPVSARL